MRSSSISFTYQDLAGQVGEIDLMAMRKLWIDQHRAGIVFAEADPCGGEVLHEVVVSDEATTGAMAAVMESLLSFPTLQRVEQPVAGTALTLEFRTDHPQVVTLAPRSSNQVA